MLANTATGVAAGLRRRAALCLYSMVVFCAGWPASSAEASVGPTTREVIEFTRIIQPVKHDDATLQDQVSPDGNRAFIVTRVADVATDVNKFDILLLDVNPSRLAAGRQAAPIRLLTVIARTDSDDGKPSLQDARWVSSRTIAFRARMNDELFQVYRIDVATRRLTQMTYAPLGVLAFDVTPDLRRVVYVGPVPNPAVPSGARSVVVGNKSFWSIHGLPDDFRTQQRRFQYFVAEAGSRTQWRPLGDVFAESSFGFPSASISPDGRWVLLPKYEPGRQISWLKQYPAIAEAVEKYGLALTSDPLGYYSRPRGYVVRRVVAYRLADGQEKAVVDAPDDSVATNQRRTDRLWQDGGKSVVVAGTYLPQREVGGVAAGATGAADLVDGKDADTTRSHLIEYWPDAGRWKLIAVLKDRLKSAYSVAGSPRSSGAFVAIDGGQPRRFERSADGSWRETADAASGQEASRAWRLHVQQALNQPPDVVALGPAGASVPLTQLNPQYSASWGTMREYGWSDAKGRSWKGGLMVPADFNSRKKHALVIQTYGFSPTRFYRDGANEDDGFTSGFAGRAFLRDGIIVLALPWRASSGAPADEHGALVAFADGVRGAIDALVAEGLVDRERIGIMGWSATGERVLNLLTFTDSPIRAATLLDGDANTLFSMTITYAVLDTTQVRKERANGGGPYGASRANWIRNDPSLHTDCIRAALRIETYGPEVKNNWDIYALLRRQYRPVEMIRIPKGAHALARPGERMISLQGNVDWFRFWLKGERRFEPIIPTETSASLIEQYERWDQMAKLKQEADAKPRCEIAASSDWASPQVPDARP